MTRNNLHPSYTALPKNSESWRINPIYQTSKEICASSPRASNEWLFILRRDAGSVRLPIQAKSKQAKSKATLVLRRTIAPGTRCLGAMFDN